MASYLLIRPLEANFFLLWRLFCCTHVNVYGLSLTLLVNLHGYRLPHYSRLFDVKGARRRNEALHQTSCATPTLFGPRLVSARGYGLRSTDAGPPEEWPSLEPPC
jgi:hypothetical protein